MVKQYLDFGSVWKLTLQYRTDITLVSAIGNIRFVTTTSDCSCKKGLTTWGKQETPGHRPLSFHKAQNLCQHHPEKLNIES